MYLTYINIIKLIKSSFAYIHIYIIKLKIKKNKINIYKYIYRTLVVTLIENHENLQLREFILCNFSETFRVLETIPLNILLDPLIKQI